MRNVLLSAMGGLLLALVSCSPVESYGGGVQANGPGRAAPLARMGLPDGPANTAPTATPTAEQQRELRERRRSMGQIGSGNSSTLTGRTLAGSAPGGFESGRSTPRETGALNDPAAAPLPPLNTDYRYGIPYPGRKGWVYNPYTMTAVDVRSVASGYLIYDEKDPANRNPDGTLKPVSEMPHKFRVP